MNLDRKTADIFIDDELRKVLEAIKTQSMVAKLLLKKRINKELLVDSFVNYIGISSNDRSKISYLSQDRKSKMGESEYWSSKGRFQIKPGGFVSKILKNINPKDVEIFSNLYKAETNKPNFEFKIVSGQEIKDYYHYSTYAKEEGSLGLSCMKHENTQKLLNLYRDNSDTISLLVMLNENGGLMGRALLWNTKDVKVMDRIYTIDDEHLVLHFKKWATKNNYYYKSEQNWFNSLSFEQMDKPSREIKISIKIENSRYFPYMDTFKFIDLNNVLYNYQPKDVGFKTLCSCDGNALDSDYLKFDDIDRTYRYSSDIVNVKYLSLNTRATHINRSDINNQYILKVDSVYNSDLDDYIFSIEYDHLNNWDVINNAINTIKEKEALRLKEREAALARLREQEQQESVISYRSDDLRRFMYSVFNIDGHRSYPSYLEYYMNDYQTLTTRENSVDTVENPPI